MKCRQFQDLLFEYTDGSLSPGLHAKVELHLAQCHICRQVVQRQQQFGTALSTQLRESTKSLKLDRAFEHRFMTSLEHSPTHPAETTWLAWWRQWLVWPAAAAASLVAFLLVGHYYNQPRLSRIASQGIPGREVTATISIEMSQCVPTYTFQKTDNQVTDTWTCKAIALHQTLFGSNIKSGRIDQERKM